MNRVVAALSSIGGVLRNTQLRRVELAWGASIVAEWANFVALGVFAYHVGGTLAVGVAGLVRLLPSLADYAATSCRRRRVTTARAIKRSTIPTAPTMLVTTAIVPATSLVSAQMRPIIVPTTSTATIAASQYRIRRRVMSRAYSHQGISPIGTPSPTGRRLELRGW